MKFRKARNTWRRRRIKEEIDKAFGHLPWVKPPRYEKVDRLGDNLVFYVTGKTTEGVWLRFNATLWFRGGIFGSVMAYLRAARKE